MLGQDPELEELVDAVDGQEAGVGGGELGRHRHLDRVCRHHRLGEDLADEDLAGEDLAGEDRLDPRHPVGPQSHLDARGLADELGHGSELAGVEVDGGEEDLAVLLVLLVLLAVHQPADPGREAPLQRRLADQRVASDQQRDASRCIASPRETRRGEAGEEGVGGRVIRATSSPTSSSVNFIPTVP